jgi:hypothetical protein
MAVQHTQMKESDMGELDQLVTLLEKRNAIDKEISELIGRPAYTGYISEYLAAKILGIQLQQLGNNKGDDGIFVSGPTPLLGCKVNVKYASKRPSTLDLPEKWQQRQQEGTLPDYYLVICGPAATSGSSKGEHHPFVIESVYLFETRQLLAALVKRQVKIGTATSVNRQLWKAAELFPSPQNTTLPLSEEQKRLFHRFREYDQPL